MTQYDLWDEGSGSDQEEARENSLYLRIFYPVARKYNMNALFFVNAGLQLPHMFQIQLIS